MVWGSLFRLFFVLLITFSSLLSQAQYEGDDVYDPFADYSEFEENSQEEADINFFRNGRFFNMAFMVGGRMYTGGMGQHVEPAIAPGFSLTYWFNLRLALMFSYTYSQHYLGPIPEDASDANTDYVEGNMSLNSLSFDLKYYFNTNNVTRGLADLNPYVLIGFSQNTRNFSFVDELQVAKDDGPGLDIGAGIEVPIARNQMFLGLQFVYTYVNFSGENNPLRVDPPVFLDGDIMSACLLLGFNFL